MFNVQYWKLLSSGNNNIFRSWSMSRTIVDVNIELLDRMETRLPIKNAHSYKPSYQPYYRLTRMQTTDRGYLLHSYQAWKPQPAATNCWKIVEFITHKFMRRTSLQRNDATGVELNNGHIIQIKYSSINRPQILLLSNIGPAGKQTKNRITQLTDSLAILVAIATTYR